MDIVFDLSWNGEGDFRYEGSLSHREILTHFIHNCSDTAVYEMLGFACQLYGKRIRVRDYDNIEESFLLHIKENYER
mgnify:CR=1 FL=1